jgi:hypothetical protein
VASKRFCSPCVASRETLAPQPGCSTVGEFPLAWPRGYHWRAAPIGKRAEVAIKRGLNDIRINSPSYAAKTSVGDASGKTLKDLAAHVRGGLSIFGAGLSGGHALSLFPATIEYGNDLARPFSDSASSFPAAGRRSQMHNERDEFYRSCLIAEQVRAQTTFGVTREFHLKWAALFEQRLREMKATRR